MSSPERHRLFALGVGGLTLLVPGLLLLGHPFDEARHVLGTLTGWGLALAVIAPSYALMARCLRAEVESSHGQRFFKIWAGSTMGRMLAVIVGVVLFALCVEAPPLFSFLLAFFLGYTLLTGLEVLLLVGGTAGRRHA